jgi:hypothetical protein
MARAYNQHVNQRVFRPGDLVLKKIMPSNLPDPRGKFRPVWEGPFVVREVLPRGALRLTDQDGQNLAEPINSDYVKAYFG